MIGNIFKKKNFVLMFLIFLSYAETKITINNKTSENIIIALKRFREDKRKYQHIYHLEVPSYSKQYIILPSSIHTLSGKKHYHYTLSVTNNIGGYKQFATKVSKDTTWSITKNNNGELLFTKK